MNKYDSVIFMGPPGSMKTKAGKLFAEENNSFYHFSTGETFRGLNDNYQIFDCSRINNVISCRRPVPSNITSQIFGLILGREILFSNYRPFEQTIILDGIPRNKTQFAFIDSIFNIKQVLLFNIGKDEIFRRCLRRANRKFRADDNGGRANIERGIREYEYYTLPVLDLIEPYKIHQIDSKGSKEKVYSRVRNALLSNSSLLK